MISYRPELDGVRAIAVVSVVLFHAESHWLPGGFLGVDVFFVLSGYLITNIIAGDLANNRFSLATFYMRRIRRILPALFTVIFASIPFAYLILFPADFREFAKSVIASVLFVSNILFYKTIDYFNNNVEFMPFVHTWSLAVEEQYYIFFPFLLRFALKRKEFARKILWASFIASFAMACVFMRTDKLFNFYMLPTRYWEICAGALIVLLAPASRSRRSEVFAAVGLFSLLASMVLIDATAAHPGPVTLFPIFGAVLLIRYARSDTAVGKFLGWKPISAIGLISYSVYLWHQPVFAFAISWDSFFEATAAKLGLILLVFVLAALSWRFVEQPFRTQKISPRQILGFAGSSAVIIIGVGAAIDIYKGFPGRWPAATALLDQSETPDPHCSGTTTVLAPASACSYNAPSKAKVALWGDSHASVVATALAAQFSKLDVGLRQFSQYGCLPVPGLTVANTYGGLCPEFNQRTLEYIQSHAEIETIILMARWPMYLDGSRFDNEEGGHSGIDDGYATPGKSMGLGAPERIQAIQAEFKTEISALIAAGKRVVIVDPIPEMGWRIPERMKREIFRAGEAQRGLISIKEVAYEKRRTTTLALFNSLPADPNLVEVDVRKLFCGDPLPGRCMAERDGRPLYFDDNHLSRLGADILAREIAKELAAKNWL